MRVDLFTVLAGALVLAATTYACGADDPAAKGTNGADGGPSAEAGDAGPAAQPGGFEGAVAALALATCRTIYECPSTNDEVGGLRVLFSSAEDCAQKIRSHWRPRHRVWGNLARLDHIAPLAANGTVTVDRGALEACVAATVQCVPSEACQKIFVGSGAEGTACAMNEACDNGLYCKPSGEGTAGETCPGTCAPRIPIGSPCAGASSACEIGAACTPTGCTARPAVTAQRVGADEVCDLDVDEVTTRRLCAAGLHCQRGAAGAPGTCRPPIAAGAPCNAEFNDVCVAGHLCLGATGARTCRPVTLGAAGDGCAMNMVTPDIRPCNPWANLACLPNSTCGPGGGAEQPVLVVFDEKTCQAGFAVGTDDTCHALLAAGATCTADVACESGACDATRKCRDAYCE